MLCYCCSPVAQRGYCRAWTPRPSSKPLLRRPGQPLPSPNDWTFELIEDYHAVIKQTADRFGLDVALQWVPAIGAAAALVFLIGRRTYARDLERITASAG